MARTEPAPQAAPERPVRRVGTLTMGAALIVVGVIVCIFHFGKSPTLLLTVFRLSPLVLVTLGCEVLLSSVKAKGARLKYDFLSMFVCFFLIVAAAAASCVPLALEYAGPARQSAETRVEQAVSDAVYSRLQNKTDAVHIDFHVNLTYKDSYDAVRTGDDLGAGDWVNTIIDMKGGYADRAAFVKACRPVLDAVYAQGLPGLTLYFRTMEQPGRRDTQYSLDITGAYMPGMTDAQLAEYVTERDYIEDAGHYMDAAEAAEWQRSRQNGYDSYMEEIEELQRQLDESEELRNAMQEEAQRAMEEATEGAEARIAALEEEAALLRGQLEAARSSLGGE